MADFCKQCTEELFGSDLADNNDMKGAVSERDSALGFMVLVLCEGCGPIQVNHAGECLSDDCDKNHGKEQQGET